MKKIIVACILLGMLFAVTSCKKESPEPVVSAETEATVEGMHAQETLQLELEEGSEGEVAPD